MRKRGARHEGRPWKTRKARREGWRANREFQEARQNPEPVKVIMKGGRFLTSEEIEAAYQQTNAGRAHGAEATLEELLCHPVEIQGGDPPW